LTIGGDTGGGGTGPWGSNGSPGTPNTGGGGGGSSSSAGSGGKGVVILSIPTISFTGKTTGSPIQTISGANTILQFNDSGSYTA
jgi:hypothetical protein